MEKETSFEWVDNVDFALLDLLQKDGRATNVKLANHLNLSETPCWRRLKRLEDAGIIEGYRAKLNRRKLGFDIHAFVQVFSGSHTDDSLERFEQAIREIPEVISCHNLTGDTDYLMQIVTKDLDSYERLLRKVIRRLPGVTSVKTSVCLREIKGSEDLPLTTGTPLV